MNQCYKCKWRGEIPGDAHSECKHPLSRQELLKGGHLNIKGNAHGKRNGWFFWPFNFDPVWLENCDGFTPKEK